ncbi:MAG: hypothetical protein ACQETE_00735 [Bacteroidota bacterium]
MLKNYLLLLLIVTIGCAVDPGKSQPGDNLDLAIMYQDMQNRDLLNPEHEQSLTEENITIYWLINDEKEKVYFENLDEPKMFSIDYNEDQKKYFIDIDLNYNFSNDYSVTYLQYPNAVVDTIKIKGGKNANNGMRYFTKLWFNGELIWDTSSAEEKPVIHRTLTMN